jgi:hypothetical protein
VKCQEALSQPPHHNVKEKLNCKACKIKAERNYYLLCACIQQLCYRRQLARFLGNQGLRGMLCTKREQVYICARYVPSINPSLYVRSKAISPPSENYIFPPSQDMQKFTPKTRLPFLLAPSAFTLPSLFTFP